MSRTTDKMGQCEVCTKPAVDVLASPLGPISHAMCTECLEECRQPWSTLVGALFGLNKDNCADWVRSYIEATCEFYGKTETDLWDEVKHLEDRWRSHVQLAIIEDQSSEPTNNE